MPWAPAVCADNVGAWTLRGPRTSRAPGRPPGSLPGWRAPPFLLLGPSQSLTLTPAHSHAGGWVAGGGGARSGPGGRRAPDFASCRRGARCGCMGLGRWPAAVPRRTHRQADAGRLKGWPAVATGWASLDPAACPQPLFLGAARPASRALPRFRGRCLEGESSQCFGAPSASSRKPPAGPRSMPISQNPPRSTRVTSFKPSQPWNLLGAERPNVIAQVCLSASSPTPRRPLARLASTGRWLRSGRAGGLQARRIVRSPVLGSGCPGLRTSAIRRVEGGGGHRLSSPSPFLP